MILKNPVLTRLIQRDVSEAVLEQLRDQFLDQLLEQLRDLPETTVIWTLTFSSLQGRRQPTHQDELQGQRAPEETGNFTAHTHTHT